MPRTKKSSSSVKKMKNLNQLINFQKRTITLSYSFKKQVEEAIMQIKQTFNLVKNNKTDVELYPLSSETKKKIYQNKEEIEKLEEK